MYCISRHDNSKKYRKQCTNNTTVQDAILKHKTRQIWHQKSRIPSRLTSYLVSFYRKPFTMDRISKGIKATGKNNKLWHENHEKLRKFSRMIVTVQNWRSGIVLYSKNHFPKFWEFSDIFVSPAKKSGFVW